MLVINHQRHLTWSIIQYLLTYSYTISRESVSSNFLVLRGLARSLAKNFDVKFWSKEDLSRRWRGWSTKRSSVLLKISKRAQFTSLKYTLGRLLFNGKSHLNDSTVKVLLTQFLQSHKWYFSYQSSQQKVNLECI